MWYFIIIGLFYIDSFRKSHNASEWYPKMHHSVTEMCTNVHISVTKWCIVGIGLVHWGIYGTAIFFVDYSFAHIIQGCLLGSGTLPASVKWSRVIRIYSTSIKEGEQFYYALLLDVARHMDTVLALLSMKPSRWMSINWDFIIQPWQTEEKHNNAILYGMHGVYCNGIHSCAAGTGSCFYHSITPRICIFINVTSMA